MKNSLQPALFSHLRTLGLSVLLGLSPAALAQTAGEWTGGGGSDNQSWNDPDNWDDETIPGTTIGSTNGDTALFRPDSAGVPPEHRTIEVDEGRLIYWMEFARQDNSTTDFTFNGETLRVADGGAISKRRASGDTPEDNQTFNIPILIEPAHATADATFVIADSGGGRIVFNEGISGGNTSGTVELQTSGNNNFGVEFNGVVSDGDAGALRLRVDHGVVIGGRLVLGAANTYTGGTIVESGGIIVENDEGFGAGLITWKDGKIWDSTRTFENDLFIDGTLRTQASSITWDGNILLGGGEDGVATSRNQSGTHTFNGVISDDGNGVALRHDRAGAIVLNNPNNSFSGGYIMDAGSNRSLTLGADTALGTGPLIVRGGGRFIGTARTLPNDVILDGELRFSNTGYTIDGDIQIGTTETANPRLGFDTGARPTVTFNGQLSNGEHGRTLEIQNGTYLWTADNILTDDIIFKDGILRIGNGGSTGLIGSSAITMGESGNTTVHFNRTGSYTVENAFSGTTNDGQILIEGSGVATFTAASTYTGPTTVENGATLLMDGSHIGSGDYTVRNGSAIGGSGLIDIGTDTFSLEPGARLTPGSAHTLGTLTLNVGTFAVEGGAGQSLVFRIGSVSDRLVFDGGQMVVTGTEELNFSDFEFLLVGGFSGGTYTLIEELDFLFGSMGSNLTGTIDGFEAELFLDGDDLMLTVVPEPATVAAILGALALGLAFWRRRAARRV